MEIFRLVLVFASTIIFLFGCKHDASKTPTRSNTHVTIRRGEELARLTTDDGLQFTLDSAGFARIENTPGIAIHYHGDALEFYRIESPYSSGSNQIKTGHGKTVEIELSDGTFVLLSSSSQLVFPHMFSGPTRRVTLVGEAYFKISNSVHSPFIIVTKYGDIVSSYGSVDVAAYNTLKVADITGLVTVKSNDKRIDLESGELIELGTDFKLNKRKDNNAFSVSWEQSKLYFENASIRQILDALSLWYPINFSIRDSSNKHFTGIIELKDSVNSVLDTLRIKGMGQFKVLDSMVIVTR
jgi:transmembrane sensor